MSLLCLGLSSIRRTKSHPENTQDVCKKSKTAVARGFQALPIEILLEIIAYTRAPDIPWPNLRPPDPACSERRKTILALSSVCRSLRTALIPVLWETIEACTAPGARVDDRPQRRKRWWKTVYKSTVRQLEAVCNRQPSYASYVKTLNILITPYCISTLARELSRTLPLFPNLTTIQITSLWWIDLCPRKRLRRLSNPTARNSSDSSYLSLHLKSSFKHLILPNVHTILLPSAATPVLSSFPNARQAYLNDTLETCYPPSPHTLSLQQSHIQRIDSVLVFIHLLGYFCPKIETFQWAINDSPSSIWTSILLRIYHKVVLVIS
ncbi:hypothetical protein F5887DRAFT_969799 [Amanita rubescens]|nr:hypothetical protein F5887DRAFT_969799 [Amanita rubescens]